MPRLFITGIALFLLLAAGYGLTQAARSIPWDCSDWQAFAHSDRPTAILESLAENRGKTLYCGIDQSDTFGKAETWQAGKDRNERDDTVYFGERGQFRGFIAAQEGWLTEGESGITGQSIATIFEFPKEERQGRRVKYKKFAITAFAGSCGHSADGQYAAPQGDRSNCAGGHATHANNLVQARRNYNTNIHPNLSWPALAESQARTWCRNRHAALSVRDLQIGTQLLPDGSASADGAFWIDQTASDARVAYQIRRWTATCVKKVKGPRRR